MHTGHLLDLVGCQTWLLSYRVTIYYIFYSTNHRCTLFWYDFALGFLAKVTFLSHIRVLCAGRCRLNDLAARISPSVRAQSKYEVIMMTMRVHVGAEFPMNEWGPA